MDLEVVLIIAAVIGFGVWAGLNARKRRAAIALLAQKPGLQFNEHHDYKIVQTFGHDDIDFESHEFSKQFVVRCKNKRFAYDFRNALMPDYLFV